MNERTKAQRKMTHLKKQIGSLRARACGRSLKRQGTRLVKKLCVEAAKVQVYDRARGFGVLSWEEWAWLL